jgi:MFS family permease
MSALTLMHRYRLSLLYCLLRNAATSVFVMTAFLALTKQGASSAAVVAGFALAPMISLLADIPSGVFADRYSYKAALWISSLLDLVAFGLLGLFGTHDGTVIFALGLKGLATAFESGAAQNLVLATASKAYGDAASKKMSVHMEFGLRGASIMGAAVAAYIVSDRPAWVWAIGSVYIFGSVCLLWSLPSTLHAGSRFSSIKEGMRWFLANIGLVVSPVILSLTVYRMMDGFRAGSEGAIYMGYLGSLLKDDRMLAALPVISTAVRLPLTFSVWKEWLPIPEDPRRSVVVINFLMIVLLLGYVVTGNGVVGMAVTTINFALYSIRDVFYRHWENIAVTNSGHPPTVLRSLLSTSQSAFQFVGGALLAWLLAHRTGTLQSILPTLSMGDSLIVCYAVLLAVGLMLFGMMRMRQK